MEENEVERTREERGKEGDKRRIKEE